MSSFISTEVLSNIVTNFNYSVDALLVKGLALIRNIYFLDYLAFLCILSIIYAYYVKHHKE